MIAVPTNVIVTPSGRPAWGEAVQNNWYEGSRWSPNRSWVWYPLQDAKKDLDKFTRYELCKKSRYLWKNSPLIRGLIERLVNLVIGCGFMPVSISSNPEWNKRADQVWKQIFHRPCVDGKTTMSQYQRIKCRERFGDGEGFTILTYSERTGRDGLAGIEADRVTGEMSNPNTDTVAPGEADGIKLDNQGMPISYKVRGVTTPYPESVVVHHFTPLRSQQARGEPILSVCINTATDIDDILALEKQAVKEASGHKDIIQTPSGELDPASFRKMQMGTSFPTTFALPGDDRARNDYYKVQFQGEPVVLRSGDVYTPYKPDRPGSAWEGFMAFLANSVVLSTGLPPSLLLPVEIGGTDVRRDMQLAERIVDTWQMDIADEFQVIRDYLIEGQILDGPLAADCPSDWRSTRWHFPKSISVDRGRDAQQDRTDVQCGLMSHEEYHARYGDDAREYQQIVENEVRQRRFRLFGTPIEEPFTDILEFVQLLSMDAKLFTAKITEDVSPDANQEPEPSSTPNPKKSKPAKK